MFEEPSAAAVAFGVRVIGLRAAELTCDAYTEAKLPFAAENKRPFLDLANRPAREPLKPETRIAQAFTLQAAKRDLTEAVNANRRRFKVISGEGKRDQAPVGL